MNLDDLFVVFVFFSQWNTAYMASTNLYSSRGPGTSKLEEDIQVLPELIFGKAELAP